MTSPLPPIRRQIVVPIDPAETFEVFTDDIGLWWPLGAHSVDGEGGTVAFRDHALVETSAGGNTSVWAEVLEWVPAEVLRLSWHPGGSPENATEVRVHFAAVETAGGEPSTLVTLEHDGWERTADPAAFRQEYESGWPTVVSRFGAATVRPAPTGSGTERATDTGTFTLTLTLTDTVTSADTDTDTATEVTWLVLRHTAGANAPQEGPIFAHPDFGEHAGFLTRLAQDGVLVAAGPLRIGSQPGAHGMTVIRIPTSDVDEYLRRATSEDQSVVRGLLAVEPIIWNVMMNA